MTYVSYPPVGKEKNLPVYVTGVGVCSPQTEATRVSPSSSFLMITVGGCGTVKIGDKRYELSTGCGLYVSSGVEYVASPGHSKNRGEGSEWLVDWVSFDFGSVDLYTELFTVQEYMFMTFRDPAGVSAAIRRIGDAISSDVEYGAYTASAETYSMLIKMNRETLEMPKAALKSNPVLDSVIEYIDERFTEDVTLSDLCKAAGGISEQYLCRIFKQYTGERPIEYILHKRIAVARSYLEKTDMEIAEVARLTGFNNTSYFYRNFKKFTGVSPLACRQGASLKK